MVALNPTVHAVVVGQVIAALRRRNHLGQQDFAKAIGVSQATLSRIERGQATPDHYVFAQVADQFGMTASELDATVEDATAGTRRAAAGATQQKPNSDAMWTNVLKVAGVVGLIGLAAFAVAAALNDDGEDD
jgi:transcriptional regulator with XRE-family HTH domain